jgi:hypothetical protein
MELKARGSENRHIPVQATVRQCSGDDGGMTNGRERQHTDDDDLFQRKRGIWIRRRHGCSITIRGERRGRTSKAASLEEKDGNQGFTGTSRQDEGGAYHGALGGSKHGPIIPLSGQ